MIQDRTGQAWRWTTSSGRTFCFVVTGPPVADPRRTSPTSHPFAYLDDAEVDHPARRAVWFENEWFESESVPWEQDPKYERLG